MKLLILLLISNISYASNPTIYPDATLTPGKVNTAVTKKQLCTSGYTSTVRYVSKSTRAKVFEEYGLIKGKFKPGDYEVDHFISLEIGGLNDIENLWPQKYCSVGNKSCKTSCYGAREKDRVENSLHKRICSNEITTEEAQYIISHDWLAEYNKLVICDKTKALKLKDKK